MCRSTGCSTSCVASSRTRLQLLLVLLGTAAALPAPALERGIIVRPASPAAVAQQDPDLRPVVQAAIEEAQCFGDRFDSEVWFKLMEPRLRRYLPVQDERVALLQQVYCETHRPGVAPLPPGLVLAVMDVESRFNRWAVSRSGAVGLMQVMPFWPEQLGMRRRELVAAEANIRMGCAILRHYLAAERNDVRRALARYNGSTGRREYPDLVVTRWTRYWAGADDLGRAPLKPS
jgi:soluble lytic murein transglycosylase-like protein